MNTGILVFIKHLAPLFLYVGAVLVGLLAISGRPKVGLLFIIPLFPLQNVVEKLFVFPLGNQLYDIILFCAVIGWIISRNKVKGRLIEPSVFNGLLLLMIVYTFISFWQGASFLNYTPSFFPPDRRLQNWKNYAVLFPLLFLLVNNNFRNLKEIRFLFLAMLLSMLLMDYYVVDQVRWTTKIVGRESLNGTFVWLGPNETAAFYAMYVFVLMGVFLTEKAKRLRAVLLLLICLDTYCLLFLFSRGAYAAFLVGLIIIFLIRKKILLVPLFIILISWQTMLPTRVVDRINQTTNDQGELDASSERRIVMWEQSIELFKHNPITGAGFNVVSYMGFALGDTHNVFIKILAEQGIIGILFIFLLFFFALRSSWKLYRTAKDRFLQGLGLGFFVCIFSAIIANMFGDRWTHTPLGAFFWIFLGMVEAGNRLVKEEGRTKIEDGREKGEEGEEKSEEGRENDEIKKQEPRVKMWKVKRGEKSS